jgi:rRNA biogenesis protein RRP5
MKVLGQIVTVQPLGLVVSLPNQLLGHVPITNITSQLTAKLEKLDEDAERGSDVSMDNDVEAEESLLPNLEDHGCPLSGDLIHRSCVKISRREREE